LLKGIVPNIVWQGGRVAATIRKVGVACAYTLLRQGLADQACLFESAPQVYRFVLQVRNWMILSNNASCLSIDAPCIKIFNGR
jgi:hypothetical protein